jgi:hypothetical protein
MALTAQDRANMWHFQGYWKGPNHEVVIQDALASYRARFPATEITEEEFVKLLDMFGHKVVAVGGGGDRPHDLRLSIGSG